MNYPAVLSSEQMNYQDRLTIESSGVPGSHLMELTANAVRMNFQSNIDPSDRIASLRYRKQWRRWLRSRKDNFISKVSKWNAFKLIIQRP